MPRNALIVVAALALCALTATAARAPTLPLTLAAASAPDPARQLPARFLGLWRLAADGSTSCPAQSPAATNVSDASLLLVRPSSVAFVESGCRVDGVRTAVSRTHPERAEPTTVLLACEGEGEVDQHTEVWSTERRGDGDALTTLDVGRGVTTSYLRCEDEPMRSARQPTAPAVPPAAAEAAEAVQDQREAGAPEPDRPSPQDDEVDRCNAPRVLSVMTSDLDRFKEAARRSFGPATSGSRAGAYMQVIEKWSLTIRNIRQSGYDATNNIRRCAADFIYNYDLPFEVALMSTGLPGVKALCARAVTYTVERTLDEPGGIYVTHYCR